MFVAVALFLFVFLVRQGMSKQQRAREAALARAARAAKLEQEKAQQLAAEEAAKEAEKVAKEKADRERHAAIQAKLWAEKEAEEALFQQQAVRRREIEAELLASWRRWVLSRHVVPPKDAEVSQDRNDFMHGWLKTAPADVWLLHRTTDDQVRALTNYGRWLPAAHPVQQGTRFYKPDSD